MFHEHRLHARQSCLDDNDVALVLQFVIAQGDAKRDIDRTADAIGRENLTLEILDRFDRAVFENQISVGKVARHVALEVVGDCAQIFHFRVFDRQSERRIGEQRNIELSGVERSDHRRAAVEPDRLQLIGFAEMLGDARLGEQDRREIRRGCNPADPDLDRIGGVRRCRSGRQDDRTQRNFHKTDQAHRGVSYPDFAIPCIFK